MYPSPSKIVHYYKLSFVISSSFTHISHNFYNEFNNTNVWVYTLALIKVYAMNDIRNIARGQGTS